MLQNNVKIIIDSVRRVWGFPPPPSITASRAAVAASSDKKMYSFIFNVKVQEVLGKKPPAVPCQNILCFYSHRHQCDLSEFDAVNQYKVLFFLYTNKKRFVQQSSFQARTLKCNITADLPGTSCCAFLHL